MKTTRTSTQNVDDLPVYKLLTTSYLMRQRILMAVSYKLYCVRRAKSRGQLDNDCLGLNVIRPM